MNLKVPVSRFFMRVIIAKIGNNETVSFAAEKLCRLLKEKDDLPYPFHKKTLCFLGCIVFLLYLVCLAFGDDLLCDGGGNLFITGKLGIEGAYTAGYRAENCGEVGKLAFGNLSRDYHKLSVGIHA